MFEEKYKLNYDGIHYEFTLKGPDQITLLNRRNAIIRFILDIPETIELTEEAMKMLEIAELERTWKLSQ